MTASHSIRYGTVALGLLLAAALLTLPLAAQAALAPEETPLSSPWFPQTLSAGTQRRPPRCLWDNVLVLTTHDLADTSSFSQELAIRGRQMCVTM